jgi:hypothetical protein
MSIGQYPGIARLGDYLVDDLADARAIRGVAVAEGEFFRTLLAYADTALAKINDAQRFHDLRKLVNNPLVFGIGRFLYLVEILGLHDQMSVAEFIESHNRRMQTIVTDDDLLARRDRPRHIYEAARIQADGKRRILAAAVDGKIRFDSTNIGKFLVEEQGVETIRPVLHALRDLGFVKYVGWARGASLVVPEAPLLTAFEAYVRCLRNPTKAAGIC